MALTEASVSQIALLPQDITALLICPGNQIRLLGFCSSVPSQTHTDCETSDSIPLYAFCSDLIRWKTVSRPDGSDFNRPSRFVVELEQSSDFMKQRGEIAPPILPQSECLVFTIDLTGTARAKVMAGGLQQQLGQRTFAPRGFGDGYSAAFYTHQGKAWGHVEIFGIGQMIRHTHIRPDLHSLKETGFNMQLSVISYPDVFWMVFSFLLRRI